MNDYQAILENDYPGAEAFTRSCLNPVFGPVKPARRSLTGNLSDADKSIVKDIFVFGSSQNFSFGEMNFFDVTLQDSVDIARNRVTIQRAVRKSLDSFQAAIGIFHYEDNKSANGQAGLWRFSFINKLRNNKETTSAKRYSYICGKNRPCRTAADRFRKLENIQGKKSIEDVTAVFSIEALTKEFFNLLFKWYDNWAVNTVRFPVGSGDKVHLPKKLDETAQKENRQHLIRLITRLIFVWFLRQKENLVPSWIFDIEELKKTLIKFDAHSEKSGSYYNAILQNLFFATLNCEIKERKFFEEKDGRDGYGIKAKYRDHIDKPIIQIPHKDFIQKMESIPFLNGGLFECLDRREEHKEQEYKDGFSRESKRAAFVPNCLFFGDSEHEGLIDIFSRYNFTIEENTPQDIEIALDPELLGKVFENLLGTYNEETASTARNESGSFYTPREIVEYMVDTSLKEYFKEKLPPDLHGVDKRLDTLFSYNEPGHDFDSRQVKILADAVKTCKILDPACGSGAFPMGILNKLLFVMEKIDSDRKIWQDNYSRKIFLIENCIYGVDIQPIAIQISKLRFFISLIVDQKTGGAAENNYNVLPLPNLETKFVAANTLIGIKKEQGFFADPKIEETQKELLEIRHKHFSPRSVKEKDDLREKDKKLTKELVELLKKDGFFNAANAAQMAKWNPYSQTEPSDFFDPWWMFGIDKGFDVVIGNPPYVSAPTMVDTNPQLRQTIVNSKRFATLYQKWDLYIPFMELGIQLLSQNGQFAMIVPYPLTNQTYAKKIREFIVNQCNLIEIVDLNGTKVFENATVSNCIPFISKSQPSDSCFISHINEHKEIKHSFRQLLSALVQDEKTAVWNLTTEKREASRYSEMNVLGDFCYISVGMVLNADEKIEKGKFTKDDLISETYDPVHCRKYIEAKDIEKYRVKKIRYLEYNTKRCPDKLRQPTFRELYEKPKLMFNRLGNLMVILDSKTRFLHSDSMFSAVLWKDLQRINNKSISASVTRYSRFSRKEMETFSKQIDLRYLLGVLNSKYASVLLSNLRGGDYHIYPEHLRNLPIPSVSDSSQRSVISLVDRIIAAKAASPEADTSVLERELDNIVYNLYGIDDNERKVIEQKPNKNGERQDG